MLTESCLLRRGRVGDHRGLALILYAPGSVYDRKVEADLASKRVVFAERNPRYEDFGEGANGTGANAAVELVDAVFPRALNVVVESVAGDERGAGPIGSGDGGSSERIWNQL